jgi:ATPase subunit of ABC transporter with duplicated ATPase domains
MPSLHLDAVSYAHVAATPLFTEVSLDLASLPGHDGAGWVGVVGPNGAGKTSLLRLVANQLSPMTGRIDVHSALAPRLVPQDVAVLTDDIRSFAAKWDGVAERLRRRLGLETDDLDADVGRGWEALSPGQRKRWQLAAAMAEEPDVLLLDEPTNHLDGASRELLLDLLERFDGLGLVVSHDRVLLERLTTRTLRIHRRGIELHAGAYAEASSRWRAAEAARRAAHDRASQELTREQRLLGDVRRTRHSAEAGPRRERRQAGAAEPDAREAGRKGRQRRAEAAIAQRISSTRTRVERARQLADELQPEREVGGTVGFRHEGTGRRVLATLVGDVPNGSGEVWLRDVDLALHRGEHVEVAGVNGAGKTTLLSALERELLDTGETVAALPQELADPVAELAAVTALDPDVRGRVLGTLAQLGVDPEQLLVTDAPSPGEARKLALARLLVGEASVLVLDEPTNHLDLPSIERLEAALAGWPGALLLTTHDHELARGVTATRWHVQDHRVTIDVRHGRPA